MKTKMSKKGSKFKYKPREKDKIREHASQSGATFDSIFLDRYPVLRMKEGEYRIRILPPTWDDADWHGFPIYVHYIGPDNSKYLCLDKMGKGKCPVCEYRKEAMRDGDEDAWKLSPSKRYVVWVIDRDAEEEGPQLWDMPYTLDRDIACLMEDKRTGDYILIDDPENGYDIEFRRTGKPPRVRYPGLMIARRESPLSDDPDKMDEWLDYVTENPAPECLKYYDFEYINDVFGGGVESSTERSKYYDEDEDDEDDLPVRRKTRIVKDEDEDDDTPPWEEDDSPRRSEARKKLMRLREDDEEEED